MIKLLLFLILLSNTCFAATLTSGYTPVVFQGGSTPQLQNASIYDTGTTSGSGNVGIANEVPVETLDVTGNFRATAIYETSLTEVVSVGISTYACWTPAGKLISQSNQCGK